MNHTVEQQRLADDKSRKEHWRLWGPYLSERQWGTVREDYSAHGDAWDYFPHDQARSRAYRWGEDGLLGISDNHQRLCFSLALWNGKDPILKERLFGLTGHEGNHGEDVKEYYFYLDNTPTHSYMKALYKYPQAAFPYTRLVEENKRRGRLEPEFELADTGVFADNKYFDVQIEYAKNTPDDVLIRVSATNRGPDDAPIDLIPTLWFRNTWAWGRDPYKPSLSVERRGAQTMIRAEHKELGSHWLYVEPDAELLFTDNETNNARLFGVDNASPFVKDGINRYIVDGERTAVNPAQAGTKAAVRISFMIAAGKTKTICLRLANSDQIENALGPAFDAIFDQRTKEADAFHHSLIPDNSSADHKNIQRQALAGLLWSKQFYHYIVADWLRGDPAFPPPPAERLQGRNKAWEHLYNDDILSMPDTWEYPWFAAWDLAFHTIPLAMVDAEFAKRQLDLLTREWYMHPNGQIPAYEWAFGDVNPPVHAWAAWQVYKIEEETTGVADRFFLERVFQKLLLNFTWWVNRKDAEGNNIFAGGFLGLDNIGIFDRSKPLPTGGYLEQSDGTSWMAMYALNMLIIAIELAKTNHVYEDIASKFFEHFLHISNAMSQMRGDEITLWDKKDGFFYDVLHLPDGRQIPLTIRSMVGIVPLFAIAILENNDLFQLPGFNRRLQWFMEHEPAMTHNVTCAGKMGVCERRILSIVSPEQLKRILKYVLDENEFLSPYGIRALSRYHKDHPYIFSVNGVEHSVDYEPGESTSGLFGGNSNWRGPIWMPLNYLLIESLQKFHHYFGDDFKVECPTGSGQFMSLWEVSQEISRRLIRLFEKDKDGQRAALGENSMFQVDPHWKDFVPFYEYFDGDNGTGLGASHQTGWTGLVAKMIQQQSEWNDRRSAEMAKAVKSPR
jgi:hypothetical protein